MPPHYRPEHAALWNHRPAEQAMAWRQEHGITAASDDELRVQLLLVDVTPILEWPDFPVGG